MKKTLENSDEDHFRNVIELTWKFVTLPNPLIVCQPNSFNYHIHSLEYGYWDRLAKDSELIYTRPVVYHEGSFMLFLTIIIPTKFKEMAHV